MIAAGMVVGGCADDHDDDGPLGSLDGGLDAGHVNDGSIDGGGDAGKRLGFFVSSATSPTGNLGGLAGADARCRALAAAVGAGDRTWRAFLSVEKDGTKGGSPTAAGERIGAGPWYNAEGRLVAADLASLFMLTGDPALFIDEQGNRINGQWSGSPSPNQHDILTGTLLDGGVALGKTCDDWTSATDASVAMVGHSDGLGPMEDRTPPRNSWYAAHDNAGCNDTLPLGGAGRIYCFAAD
ncbi:MAG TPA: hypothetical protein VI299_11115 [Polyangiales bacterium]